jgi:flagellar biosynthesis GTPase FlhF
MPELKFSAADTSLAMEEVQRKLGPDALILSTERRDGMIEIVATNDPKKVEEASRQASEKIRSRKEANFNTVIEGGTINQDFSKIIDIEKARYEEITVSNEMDVSPDVIENLTESKQKILSKSDLVPEFNRISTELQLLIDSAVALGTEQGNSLTTASKMKGLGFSGKTINNLFNEADVSIEMSDFINKFTRKIVNGKDKVFDASQIILVCGPEQAGKTVLSNKLSQFLPPLTEGQPNRVISDPLSGDLASMFDAGVDAGITSLFRKRQNVNLSQDRLIID